MWHISIRGSGSHHNKDYPKDAEKMAAEFVRQLEEAGHTVESADFTHGGRDTLKPPPQPPPAPKA